VRATPASVLGAYTRYGNVAADQAIGAELGHPLAFGSDYIPYAQGWAGMVDPRIESRWAHSGLRMVYGLPMFPSSCGISGAACWNAGAAGNDNAYFSQIARNLVSNGQGNAILRLGGDAPYFVNHLAGFIGDNDVIEAGLWDYQGQFPSSANPDATTALIKDF
jgi:hypothetical protein